MMKSKILISVLFLVGNFTSVFGAQSSLDQRVSELSQQIATKMSAKQKTTIAVIEFTDLQGRVTDFGRFLAEELITRLYDTEKFKVIERQQLNKVIAEQKLSLTGVVDPASARQLGKLLGVDAIASGTYTDLSQSLKVNARLISTATGEIFAVASTEIFKDESVTRLLAAGSSATGTVSGANETKPIPLNNPPNAPAAPRVTSKDFTFELQSCRASGGTLTCQFTVVNDAGQDRYFNLQTGSESRAFDESGNEYRGHGGQLGSQVPRYPNISLSIDIVLVPHVITKGFVKFEDVNPEATKLSVLRLGYSWDYGNYTVDFRNVVLKK